MAAGYNYQPLQQNDPANANSYFQPKHTDPATPSPAYVTAPASPGVLEMAPPGGPSSSSVSAEPAQKPSKEESNRSLQEEKKSSTKESKSKEKHAAIPLQQHHQQQYDFNPMDKKYRCCCGCMNVKKGAMTIGIFQMVFILGQLLIHFISCKWGYAKEYDIWPFEIYLNAVFSMLIVISVCFLFVAISIEKGEIFIPWQLVSLIQIAFFIFVGFCSIFQFFSADRLLKDQSTAVNVVLLITDLVFLGTVIGLLIWWNLVIQKCKKYFAEKQKRRPMQIAEI